MLVVSTPTPSTKRRFTFLVVLVLVAVTAGARPAAAAEKYFPSPALLAKAVLDAYQSGQLRRLVDLVPTPDELQAWFGRAKEGDPATQREREALLERARQLLGSGAALQFTAVRKRAQELAITFDNPSAVESEVLPMLFYSKADVFVRYPGAWRLALRGCIRTDMGWVYLADAEWLRSED